LISKVPFKNEDWNKIWGSHCSENGKRSESNLEQVPEKEITTISTKYSRITVCPNIHIYVQISLIAIVFLFEKKKNIYNGK